MFKNTPLFALIVMLSACVSGLKQSEQKINGISFVASPSKIDSLPIKTVVKETASNFLAIMPFAFCYGDTNPAVYFNQERQWWGEKTVGVIETIQMAHRANQQVLLKPQLWIRHGSYTGKLAYKNEKDWQTFETDYQNFIMSFAAIAEKEKVAIFCIGTELEQFIESRPEFWKQLIKSVKEVYSGKITYAANWDEYRRTPFWDQLDYIGIDAYFPLSEKENPTKGDLKKSLSELKITLSSFSKSENRPILFTEYGFRSMNYSARSPWESASEHGVNLNVQATILSTFYEELWSEEYIAGGFLWKWFHENDKAGGFENSGFTPQNKPALSVVKKQYSK
jgi:hypothetical protein